MNRYLVLQGSLTLVGALVWADFVRELGAATRPTTPSGAIATRAAIAVIVSLVVVALILLSEYIEHIREPVSVYPVSSISTSGAPLTPIGSTSLRIDEPTHPMRYSQFCTHSPHIYC